MTVTRKKRRANSTRLLVFGFKNNSEDWLVMNPNKHSVQRVQRDNAEQAWDYAKEEIMKEIEGVPKFTLVVELPEERK